MSDTDGDLGFQADGNQGASDGSNANSLEQTLQSLLKRLDALEAHQRTAQSGKDRGINQVQKQQQALQSEFAEVKAYLEKYPDPADAERFYNLDQLLANAKANPQNQFSAPANVASAGGQAQVSNETSQFIQQLGVDQNSPEFLAQIGAGKSPEQAALAVLAAGKQGVQDGVASGISGGQGKGSVQTSQEVLRSQFEAELNEAQKANGGFLRPDTVYIITEKYARLGLQGIGYE